MIITMKSYRARVRNWEKTFWRKCSCRIGVYNDERLDVWNDRLLLHDFTEKNEPKRFTYTSGSIPIWILRLEKRPISWIFFSRADESVNKTRKWTWKGVWKNNNDKKTKRRERNAGLPVMLHRSLSVGASPV